MTMPVMIVSTHVHRNSVHRAYARDVHVHGGHACDVRVRDDRGGHARSYGNLFLHGHAHRNSVHRAYARDDRVRDDHVLDVHHGCDHGGHDVLHDCAHACVRFLFYNPFTCPP